MQFLTSSRKTAPTRPSASAPVNFPWTTSAALLFSNEKNARLLPISSPAARRPRSVSPDFVPTGSAHLFFSILGDILGVSLTSSLARFVETKIEIESNIQKLMPTGTTSRNHWFHLRPQPLLSRLHASSWPRSSRGWAKIFSLRRRVTSPPSASSCTFSSPCSGLQQPTRRSKLSNGILPDMPLMPVAQDSVRSCKLRIRHVWMVHFS